MIHQSTWKKRLPSKVRSALLAGIAVVVLMVFGAMPTLDRTATAQDPNKPKQSGKMRKPSMADTVRANIYADNWFMLYINGELAVVDFDDSSWPNAKEYTEDEVKPKQSYYDNDFQGAKFIWSDDVKLDNLVLFRKRIDRAPDGKEFTDFSNLNNVVPEQPPRGDRRGQPK